MTKAVKNKKTNKTTKVKKQDNTLMHTFIFLIITVVILIVVALNMENLTSEKTSDMVIPVLGENVKNEIIVEVADLKGHEQNEYNFTITNYKEDKMSATDVDYDIKITTPSSVKVKLYKNNKDKNILDENYSSKNNKLSSKEKIKDAYKLVIEGKNLSDGDSKITIEINS